MPEITIKSNGYVISSRLQDLIDSWTLFLCQNLDVKSFSLYYYGDKLVFADCFLVDGNYGNFVIFDDYVKLSGFHCSDSQLLSFASSTLNDPYFSGKLEV